MVLRLRSCTFRLLFLVLLLTLALGTLTLSSRRTLALYVRRYSPSVALLKVLYCVMRTPVWVHSISTLFCIGLCCTMYQELHM